MKCPHCLENFTEDWQYHIAGDDTDGRWNIRYCRCDNSFCKRIIIQTMFGLKNASGTRVVMVYPKGYNRIPLSSDVPERFSQDYKEACLVLNDSPKASAALSRRCLQLLLKDEANTTKKDLADQIQEVLDSSSLPTYLSQGIDAIRNIGNFAAHPNKSKNSGEVIEVEPGEAEWNLDILEQLFDFYFVQPAILQRKRDALNQKLQDAGKPLMK